MGVSGNNRQCVCLQLLLRSDEAITGVFLPINFSYSTLETCSFISFSLLLFHIKDIKTLPDKPNKLALSCLSWSVSKPIFKSRCKQANLVAATNRSGRRGAPKSIFKTNSSGLSAAAAERKEITEALVKGTEWGVMLTPRRGASGRKSENCCRENTRKGQVLEKQPQ